MILTFDAEDLMDMVREKLTARGIQVKDIGVESDPKDEDQEVCAIWVKITLADETFVLATSNTVTATLP